MKINCIGMIKRALFFVTVTALISGTAVTAGSSYRYDRLVRDEGRTLILSAYRTQLETLQIRERNLIRESSAEGTTHERRQEALRELVTIRAQIADVMNSIQNLSPISNQNAGALIARGLAGYDNFDYLDGVKIDGTFDGFKQGLIIRTADSVGKVMGPRITGYLEAVLGGSCDFVFSSLMDIWHDAMDIFFHSGKEPFDSKVLNEWLQLIKISFDDLERMMKDGLKENLRGYNMAKRKFGGNFEGLLDDKETASGLADAGCNDDPDTVDLIWLDLISGYADQFERLCDEIDYRIGYYDELSMEVFYANQIKKRLQSFKTILLESKSLIDLDGKLNCNKSLITVVSKNVDNLFKRLIVMVEPRTYSHITAGDTSSSLFDRKSKKSSSSYSLRNSNDGFPAAFSQGGGF